DGDTSLVSVMSVNNETGTIQPLEAVVEIAHASGAWAHTDAVQALGRIPLDFVALGLDLMSLSAHKVGGPVGVGALVVRRGLGLAPVGLGGGQESNLRSGTQLAALASAFAAASREAVASLEVEDARLRGYVSDLEALVAGMGGTRVNGGTERSASIVNVTFDGIRADDLLLLLDRAGVDCSTGSACRAGVHQPSDVLLAMGRSVADASASLRFSLGWSTTRADIDRLCELLPDALESARRALR
ncbi:MAG TPA: aminotransferase class V-fold PLP-dependent enzyme, partial [Propionibacteriaceae bacterium]|nr:aminotransferase class V-fold PLP-dependent enzyme [Propionibacteriaceae bacterium]